MVLVFVFRSYRRNQTAIVTSYVARQPLTIRKHKTMSVFKADGTPDDPARTPARVIDCLRAGWVAVLLWPGQGFEDGGIPIDIPADLVPVDLQFPNKEFDLMMVQTPEGVQPVACIRKHVDK
jgi:hypothetical protein